MNLEDACKKTRVAIYPGTDVHVIYDDFVKKYYKWSWRIGELDSASIVECPNDNWDSIDLSLLEIGQTIIKWRNTDKETIKAMLNRVGMVFSEYEPEIKYIPRVTSTLEVENQIHGDHATFAGYANFATSFYFDKDDMLVTIGVWE